MIRSKRIEMDEVLSLFYSGMSVMLGGFGGVGLPYGIVDALANSSISDLHLISNDSGRDGYKGTADLLVPGKTRKLTTTYVNGNRRVSDMIQSGELEVELVPIGTMVERIRAAGAGLGGILTPTGVGTKVAEGKEHIVVDGREYLLEKPLSADIAIVRAWKADEWGNLIFRRQEKNYNLSMLTAGRVTVAEAEEIVPTGTLDPDEITAPCVLVDYLVKI